jgi:hypothetical protein
MSNQTNTKMISQNQTISGTFLHIKKGIILALLIIALGSVAFAQIDVPVTTAPKTIYPKSVGYFSFILPIVTINQNVTTNDFSNFNNGFAIGFPVGINVLYSDKFGFSYEFTPTIKSTNGETKTSNLLFDPGPMFRFKHGVTLITRLAFETSGRYGFTPVLNKVVMRSKFCNLFAAVSMPVRFGDSELPTIGGNFQFGITLN